MSLRSKYDAWHQWRHEADPERDDSRTPWYDLVREYIGDVGGLKILEVACGRGGLLRELSQRGANVTGCDFSFPALQASSGKLGSPEQMMRTSLLQADLLALPFADESFDVVVSCETIEHVREVETATREMHRVTRKGGRLLLTTPNYANLMGLYELYARVRHPMQEDDQPFDRRQWFPQVQKWIRAGGWKIVRTDGAVHQFPIVPGRNPLRWRALDSNRTLRKMLSPAALTYFVMGEK
jgi:ubiquinone/menaquinone biosynthesis C-methylase UbiE